MAPEVSLFGATLPIYQAWGVVTGVFYAVIMYPIARRAGIGWWDYWKTGVVACIALWLGSRLFFDFFEFRNMPGLIFIEESKIHYPLRAVLPLGFTYLGGIAMLGLLEGILGLTPLVKPGPGRILDVLTPVTAFSFCVSKLGCVFAGCCYGSPTDSWWGVRMRHIDSDVPVSMVPVRFLEIGFSLALAILALFALFRWRERLRIRDGTIFAAYLLLAALARFGFGYLRGDYEVDLGSLSAPQWGALGLVGIAAVALGILLALRPAIEQHGSRGT